jgi:hypothetical protein
VDNQKFFETETKTVIASKVDSLNNVFEKQKLVFVNENTSLRTTNDTLRSRMAKTPTNYRTVRNDYQNNININTNLINKNQERIDNIDEERDVAIAELKAEEEESLSSNLNENKKNKLTFILISSFIELIIMIGIYFYKFYEYRNGEVVETSPIIIEKTLEEKIAEINAETHNKIISRYSETDQVNLERKVSRVFFIFN